MVDPFGKVPYTERRETAMAQTVDEIRTKDGGAQELLNPRASLTGRVVLSILGGVAVGLTLIGLTNGPDLSAGAITADSYRLYTEARKAMPQTPTAGAMTAESYRLYTEAREAMPDTPTAGATTADSYRRYAEAMRGLSPSAE